MEKNIFDFQELETALPGYSILDDGSLHWELKKTKLRKHKLWSRDEDYQITMYRLQYVLNGGERSL